MRIGHRPERDKRVTTHVALCSRALGASGIFVDTEDPALEENVRSVVERFGGDYTIETGVPWKEKVKGFQGKVVHLTMYGQRVDEALPRIPRDEDLLVVVGAEKVPAEVYQRADFNVSVGNQPHSEIAALAIFLDRLTGGEALYADRGGHLEVVPNERGKTVVEHTQRRALRGVPEGGRLQAPGDDTLLHGQRGGVGDGVPHRGRGPRAGDRRRAPARHRALGRPHDNARVHRVADRRVLRAAPGDRGHRPQAHGRRPGRARRGGDEPAPGGLHAEHPGGEDRRPRRQHGQRQPHRGPQLLGQQAQEQGRRPRGPEDRAPAQGALRPVRGGPRRDPREARRDPAPRAGAPHRADARAPPTLEPMFNNPSNPSGCFITPAPFRQVRAPAGAPGGAA